MQPSVVATEREVLALIEQKYQGRADTQIDRRIFLAGSEVLRGRAGCIWCREPRISAELLLLHAYPESECLRWFNAASARSLSACAECLQSYYAVRPGLNADFSRFYQPATLQIFWSKVADCDAQRLQQHLANFLAGSSNAKDTSLLYALYELLLYPRHLASPSLRDDFIKVLCSLLSARKMIKVSRLLPGILVCLFDENERVRTWAVSILNEPSLERVDSFIEGAFDLSMLPARMNAPCFVDSALLLAKWLPTGTRAEEVHRLVDLLMGICEGAHFTKIFDALFSLVAKSQFPLTPLLWQDLLRKLFTAANASSYFSSSRLPPSAEPEWVMLLNDFTSQQADTSPMLYVIDRLSVFLATARSNVMVSNIGVVIIHLKLASLLPKHTQSVFRLVTGCMGLLPLLDEEAYLDAARQLINLCWRLDSFFWMARAEQDFRGFSQLLCQALAGPSHSSRAVDTIFGRLAEASPGELVNFARHRPALVRALLDHASIKIAAQSDAFALIFMLLNACHCEDRVDKVRAAVESYPERLIRGLEGMIPVLAVDLRLREAHYKEPFKNVLHLVGASFGEAFFTGAGRSLVDLFPEAVPLKKALLVATSTLALIGLGTFEEPEKSLTTPLIRTVSLAARLYDHLLPGVAKTSLQRLKVDAGQLSRLLEFACKALSVDPERQKDAALILTFIIDLGSLYAHKFGTTSTKLLGIALSSLVHDANARGKLHACVDEYEKRVKVPLPRPPADAPRPDPSKRRIDRSIIDVDLEEKIHHELLKSAEERRRERALPMALRSNFVPIVTRPASKVDQLKAELTREAASIATGPARKRMALPAVMKKPQRLDRHASSASDSEADDSDLLALKNKFEAPSNVNPTAGTRSVKLIDIADPRAAARAAGTGKPEYNATLHEANYIQQFHRKVLHFDLKSLEAMPDESVSAVPSSFDSLAHYISVFEPLLFMECRAQLSQSLEESAGDEWSFMRICGIAHVDDFHEVVLAGAEGEAEEPRHRPCDQDYLMIEFPDHNKEMLPAVVVQSGIKNGGFEAIVRLSIPADKAALQIGLREGVRLLYRKIGNVVTNLREYLALHAIGGLALAPLLFKPSMAPVQQLAVIPDLAGLCRALDINASQAKAISAVVQAINPITLIQGPPGTGKTRTIEALLGVLMSRASHGTGSRPRRIMICAPSNAAIDEIVRRIKNGLVSGSGQRFPAKVLRVGAYDMISEQVRELTLESQVDAMLLASSASSTSLLETQKRSCEELRKNLQNAERAGQEDRVKSLKTALWEARENMRKNIKFIEDTRTTIRQKILNEAQIVCCTLGSAGHEILTRIDFEHVIIDEACQAVELGCLVPLQHNCRQCVLVGDPNQLPPTVISQIAGVFSYEQSLFVRLQRQCPDSVLLLDTQYRMHPEISRFPNSYFYSGRLIDGPGMESTNQRPWHEHRHLGPFRFFDVAGQEDSWRREGSSESRSKLNEQEARIAAHLVAMLCLNAKGCNMAGKIGIVTPYKDQRRALRREIGHRFGAEALQAIEISTVDGFQGQEREVIIFSCVRTSENRGIGFLNDTRRLNVALTRAKCSLFVLGKASALVKNPIWRGLIEDAKARLCYFPSGQVAWDRVSHIRRLDNLVIRASPPVAEQPTTLAESPQRNKTPTTIQTAAQRRISAQQQQRHIVEATGSSSLAPKPSLPRPRDLS